MKARRSCQPWSELRVHEGGVSMQVRVHPAEQLRRRLIDAWVAEDDGALNHGDHDVAARIASGLRGLGVQI